MDFEAPHVCYDPEHPKGLIQRHATLSTGERLRAWTHGARRKMPTVKGLSAWGIRLGEDFAISDQGFKTSSNPMGDRFIHLGNQHIPYEKDYQKRFFVHEIKRSERRAGKLHGMSLTYPLIAGSGGLTEYYEKNTISIPLW